LGWVTYGSSRLILVGLGNLRFLQVKSHQYIPQYTACVSIGCPRKSNLLPVCLLNGRVFVLAGKHDRYENVDMSTIEKIWLFSGGGRPGKKIYVGSPLGNLNPLSSPRIEKLMIPPSMPSAS
jgi:hypothetical protein